MARSYSNEPGELDHQPMTFGKYKGKTPEWVSENDPAYLIWAFDTVKDKPVCSKALYVDCKNDIEEQCASEYQAAYE